jgi:hypothetical protein
MSLEALAKLKSNYTLGGNRTTYLVNRLSGVCVSVHNQVGQLGLNECGLNLTSQCNCQGEPTEGHCVPLMLLTRPNQSCFIYSKTHFCPLLRLFSLLVKTRQICKRNVKSMACFVTFFYKSVYGVFNFLYSEVNQKIWLQHRGEVAVRL